MFRNAEFINSIKLLRGLSLLRICLFCFVFLAGAGRDGLHAKELASFKNDIMKLTSGRHRLAGSEDGSRSASRYVEERLRTIGIEEIYVQEFPVVHNRVLECDMEVDGEVYRIYPARDNILQASVTPKEGLTAETVYVGKGQVSDYGNNLPEGKIVVLDFDCGDNWLTAFAMGARAVIFAGEPDLVTVPSHHINMPANLPRFYVEEQLVQYLKLKENSRELTIRSSCVWEEREGRNVIGVLRVPDPVIDAGTSARESVLLAAPLDSLSEIPEISPGARDAGNCAALLYMAEHFKENPPTRDIIFAFFDGQYKNHLGARRFYGDLFRTLGDRQVAKISQEERIRMFEEEISYTKLIDEILALEDVFSDEAMAMEGYRDFIKMLREYVVNLGNITMEELAPLRIRHLNLQKMLTDEEIDVDKEKIREEMNRLKPERGELGEIDRLSVEDLCWNSILRFLSEEARLGEKSNVEKLAQKLITDPDEEKQKNKRKYFIEIFHENSGKVVDYARTIVDKRISELNQSLKQAKQSQVIFDAINQSKNEIVLHISINFGDARKKWCFVHGDDSLPFFADDAEGNYRSEIYRGIKEVAADIDSIDETGLDTRSVETLYPSSRMFVPGLHVDSGVIAGMFSHYNISAMTIMDPMPRRGLPSDTVDLLDVDAMYSQATGATKVLSKLSSSSRLGRDYFIRAYLYYNEPKWGGSRRYGSSVKQSDVGDPMRSASVPGAAVALITYQNASDVWANGSLDNVPPGFSWPLVVMSQSDGVFELPVVSSMRQRSSIAGSHMSTYFGAKFDAGEVMETFKRGVDEKVKGIIRSASTAESFSSLNLTKTAPVQIANVKPLTIVGYGFSRLVPTIVMRASSTSRIRDDIHMRCEYDTIMTLFLPPNLKSLKIFNPYGLVLLENEPTKEKYQGTGYMLTDIFDHPVAMRMTAGDLYTLNEYRLDLLRKNKIGQESLEIIHGAASDLYSDIDDEMNADKKLGLFEASSAFSRKVYKPLVGVMNDLVTAVVFLLLLSIPFAYSMERLLVGTPNIYKQIGWFVGFFLSTFLLLYMVNPAFKLAATPLIIFLAFAIILLSTMVIFIMTRKLETEMKKIQGVGASAHTMDVSRLSTMTAAIAMGISTMRRRPLRTLLTCITVVLLTFTILSFASFGSSWGNRRTYVGPMRHRPARILLHNPLWGVIEKDVASFLTGYLKGEADVVPRYWLAPLANDVAKAYNVGGSVRIIAATGDTENDVMISGAIGLDQRDIDRQPHLRDAIGKKADMSLVNEGKGIVLPGSLAEALGLDDDDIGVAEILLKGENLVYAGTVEQGFGFETILSGASILPVNYKASVGRDSLASIAGEAKKGGDSNKGQGTSFVPYGLDNIVIVSSAMAERLGGKIRSITAYPADPKDTDELGGKIAKATSLPVFVGNKGAVHRLFFGTLVEASGFKDLVIPVVLGGLIVFATMLGSVADREGEIYTFSALGLAPTHIAGLFFAEASVYAVVGGMGGYLFGQIVTQILSLLSEFGLFSVPAMNFSSMNAIATIFIVMGIVLLSTTYPAIKGARAANPGIQRAWRISSPVGDIYNIAFPFTVSEYDLTGIVSFLREHFNNYRDTSIGDFATMECHIIRQKENNMLGISGYVALAPFDLGIEQKFIILSKPSDIEGIDEIQVMLKRESGAYSDWQRANKVFINGLRKQFLIWRTFDKEFTERYREMTNVEWDQLSVESRSEIETKFRQEQVKQ